MAESNRLTKEEWDALEPRLEHAERTAHGLFMQNAETQALLGGAEHTPGYVLLQHLKGENDQTAIRLFRAVEMYHHELTRANIAAAFLYGKETAASGGAGDKD
jgi:hypothetical protein